MESSGDEAGAAWGEWIVSLGEWDLFGGLTFDPKRCEQERLWCSTMVARVIPRDVVIGRFKRWVRQGQRALGRPFRYVAALEYDRKGWPHLHPLLDIGGVCRGDVVKLGQLWYGANGFAKLERPRDSRRVATYASKYLLKDMRVGDVLLSANLKRDVGKRRNLRLEDEGANG